MMKHYLKMFTTAWSGGSKKKIIISLSTIGIVCAIATGVTISYFHDTETSAGNTFTAGKLNLKIDNTCHYNGKECKLDTQTQKYFWNGTTEECFCTWAKKDLAADDLLFNFPDVKPGDNGEDTVSLHVDNNDAWVCATLGNLKNDDNGCDKPESDIDQTCGAGQGELQDNLYLTVWKDTDCDNILDTASGHCVTVDPNFDPGCGTVNEEGICNSSRPPGEPNHVLCHWTAGQPTEQVLVDNQKVTTSLWPIADATTGGVPIKGGSDYCLGAKWNVPIETSNIIQSDSVIGDITFNAVQARNMPNFKCSDMYSEVCDGVDNNFNNQIDEGPLWLNKGQACTVGLGQCQSAGTYICDTNNPAGTTICSVTAGTPGAEVCDGIDNNCDGQVDEGNPGGNVSCNTGLLGICAGGATQCQNGAIMCVQSAQPTTEVCNGKDDDCDGLVDEDGACAVCGNGILEGKEECDDGNQSNFDFCSNSCTKILDKDLDGYAGNDCNDSNAAIHPGATEIVGNSLDEDCSGWVACYRDLDNDTYGSSIIVPNGYPATNGTATTLCSASNTDSMDDTNNDCNDTNASVHPFATEVCNGLDDDCDGLVDEGISDGALCWTGEMGQHAYLTCSGGAWQCIH
jgi:predicted ribosomally synthesized peptide with SipW-like signal peptide